VYRPSLLRRNCVAALLYVRNRRGEMRSPRALLMFGLLTFFYIVIGLLKQQAVAPARSSPEGPIRVILRSPARSASVIDRSL